MHGFGAGLARAFGGALLFNLPLWMTMEMWWLGFYMDRSKLILLVILTLPLLVTLSHFSGFEETVSLVEDIVDALVAVAVGSITSTLVLLGLGEISSSMSSEEIIGKIILQTVPASIGALLAQSQFGQREEDSERRKISYWGGLFLMGVGALFMAWNVAPTEEMILIAYILTPVHGMILLFASLLIMHAFMFAMDFRGEPDIPENASFMTLLLRETIVGYAIALLLSAYVLWSFGRFDGTALNVAVLTTIVLALPAGIGAAAARLIL